jgi:hypothetical protein
MSKSSRQRAANARRATRKKPAEPKTFTPNTGYGHKPVVERPEMLSEPTARQKAYWEKRLRE